MSSSKQLPYFMTSVVPAVTYEAVRCVISISRTLGRPHWLAVGEEAFWGGLLRPWDILGQSRAAPQWPSVFMGPSSRHSGMVMPQLACAWVLASHGDKSCCGANGTPTATRTAIESRSCQTSQKKTQLRMWSGFKLHIVRVIAASGSGLLGPWAYDEWTRAPITYR